MKLAEKIHNRLNEAKKSMDMDKVDNEIGEKFRQVDNMLRLTKGSLQQGGHPESVKAIEKIQSDLKASFQEVKKHTAKLRK